MIGTPKCRKIPARTFQRNGQLIYSKVDSSFVDLTEANCAGWIIHLYYWLGDKLTSQAKFVEKEPG